MESRRRRRRTGGLEATLSRNCNEEESSGVHLPSSIIVDILSRLPTRTLLKFRCVCKNWQYLILQDPYFNKIRLARPLDMIDDIVLLLYDSLYLLELGDDSNYVHRPHWPMRFKIRYDVPLNQLILLGSCNVLFCWSDYGTIGHTLYISNPILGECVALPKPKAEVNLNSVVYIFGFSPTTEHYKILRFRPHLGLPKSEVEVYTLGTDTWRKVGYAPYPADSGGCDVNLNGAVHWTIASVAASELIYSFDVGEEQVRTIPPPPELSNLNTFNHGMGLRVLGNCLCVYHNSMDYLDLWSMKDYGVVESWTKVRILKTPIPPWHYYNLFPITLWKDGEVLFSCDYCGLLSYNHKKRSFTALKIYYPKGEKLSVCHALTYRSSFFSLKDVARTGSLRIMNVKSKQKCTIFSSNSIWRTI